ncbi:MAG: hypothetical protein IK100_00385 [Muribaculaceae bacterium]|nr:hypothetical protein [Muribaculaceae bacterium]MBR5117083.1 hypothetical protein [Muribaculaceae bacterium]
MKYMDYQEEIENGNSDILPSDYEEEQKRIEDEKEEELHYETVERRRRKNGPTSYVFTCESRLDHIRFCKYLSDNGYKIKKLRDKYCYRVEVFRLSFDELSFLANLFRNHNDLLSLCAGDQAA